MNRVLVTGVTGVVGAPIASALAERGAKVRCLVRTPASVQPHVAAVAELAAGDIEDESAVSRAMSGCDTVFHAAGIPEQWTRDPGLFDRINTGGTRHILAAARAEGVKRFVHISTQDTFDLTANPFDETMPSRDPRPSAYEASKLAAQTLVDQAGREGLNVRSIHPCAVYGPGAVRPTGMTELLYGLRFGKVPAIIDGGMPVVFNRDVAEGAILAVEKGAPGSKYILAESWQTLRQMADAVQALFPDAPRPKDLPNWLARFASSIGDPLSRVTGKPPMMSKGVYRVLTRAARPNAAAARRELGWAPTTFASGLRETFGL